MNAELLVDSLARFGRLLPAVVNGIADADLRWRPPNGNWSILEIVCHLRDEETEDFGKRLRLTLEDPSLPWPGIDPEGWAREREYNDQDFGTAVDAFAAARQQSVAWLRGLKNPAWTNTYEHPIAGELSAGDLLAAWAAHDQLHLRQIAKRRYELNGRDAAPFRSHYAGSWSA
jgi:hypothetical protein